jgi:hypothetical protein
VTALADADRLASLIAQLDQPHARDMAVRRIAEHLARHGQKFVDLAEAIRPAAPQAAPAAPSPTPEPPVTRQPRRPQRQVIHEPLVKGGFWSHPKQVGGKRVVWKTEPLGGTRGRLRILASKSDGYFTKLTCSFETDYDIYEPFRLEVVLGSEKERMITEISASGETVLY